MQCSELIFLSFLVFFISIDRWCIFLLDLRMSWILLCLLNWSFGLPFIFHIYSYMYMYVPLLYLCINEFDCTILNWSFGHLYFSYLCIHGYLSSGFVCPEFHCILWIDHGFLSVCWTHITALFLMFGLDICFPFSFPVMQVFILNFGARASNGLAHTKILDIFQRNSANFIFKIIIVNVLMILLDIDVCFLGVNR